jgi:hypothetical protein
LSPDRRMLIQMIWRTAIQNCGWEKSTQFNVSPRRSASLAYGAGPRTLAGARPF